MKKFIFATLVLLFLAGGFLYLSYTRTNILSPVSKDELRQRNLSKYAFETLAQRQFQGSPLTLETVLEENPEFTAYLFSFQNDEGKKISGQINVPKSATSSTPVVLLLRGYVEKEIYTTGIGTKNAAAFFARNGFLTISPDFLGYGSSSPESEDILESRFEKPATVLSLMASLDHPVKVPGSADLNVSQSPSFIWAHSNGGQIALSVLEITQAQTPTSLWAPVSIGFPDSILQFVDDLPDKGEYIKNDLENFASRYDFSPYSITSYMDRIQAPVQLHQGGLDDAVPVFWSENLARVLKLEKDKNYFFYPESDHNMRPDWTTAINRDLRFFRSFLSS